MEHEPTEVVKYGRLVPLPGTETLVPMGHSWTQVVKDSVTYQALVRDYERAWQEGYQQGFLEGRREGFLEGRREALRRIIPHWGERCLGAPPPAVAQALEEWSVERLRELALRIPEAKSWDELLAE